MKFKSFLAKPFAAYVVKQVKKGMQTAVADQEAIFKDLLKVGAKTQFGKDHHFNDIKTVEEFRQAVPVRDYEAIKPYIDLVKEGRHNVLWKGQPLYFAKTSGTTSGVKYIPISKDSMPNHFNSGRNAVFCNLAEIGSPGFLTGK